MNVGMSAEFQCSVQINSVQIHNSFMDNSGCLQTGMGFGVCGGEGGGLKNKKDPSKIGFFEEKTVWEVTN